MGDISKQHIINVLSFWHLPWKCEDLHNRDSEHLTTRPHTPHPHFRGHKGQVSCLKLKWSTMSRSRLVSTLLVPQQFCPLRYLWRWGRCASRWRCSRCDGTAPEPAPCRREAHLRTPPSTGRVAEKHLRKKRGGGVQDKGNKWRWKKRVEQKTDNYTDIWIDFLVLFAAIYINQSSSQKCIQVRLVLLQNKNKISNHP